MGQTLWPKRWLATICVVLGGLLIISNLLRNGTYGVSNRNLSIFTDYTGTLLTRTKLKDEPPPLTNDEFLQKHPEISFAYDDTDQLSELRESLSCMPSIFGYSQEAGEAAFPWYEYPRCSSQVEDPYPMIHLDLSKNELTMNCSDPAKGRYVLGPTNHMKLVVRAEIEKTWEVKAYPGKPVKVDPRHEYAIGTCSDSDLFDQAVYLLRPNATAADEAMKRTKHWQDLTGVKHKPLIAFHLTIDSYSRRHFFRKLPETARYLNELNKQGEFRIFDFKLHNVIGSKSVSNQIPMLAKSVRAPGRDKNVDLAEDPLWNIFKDKGFVTYFGIEECNDSFPPKLGRMPNVDHSANAFYCGLAKYAKVVQHKSYNRQRCIGPHMAHHYILNQTMQFSEAYRNNSQWLYLHLSAAHENTGQHAQTLDHDITEYLDKYLTSFKHTHDIVIYFAADHGMRYGTWMHSTESSQEFRLPAFFLIASDAVIKRIEYSMDTLLYNTKRLNSKYDMRKTMIFLSGLPYGLNISSEVQHPAVNLFTERIPNERNCEDIGIVSWQCSCTELKEISLSSLNADQLRFVMYLGDVAAYSFNREVYSQETRGLGYLCEKLVFKDVESLFASYGYNGREFVKLVIRVANNSAFRAEVTFKVGNKPIPDSPVDDVYAYMGMLKYIQIATYTRLDTYSGPCELLAKEASINSEICVCRKDLQDQRLLNNVKSKYS
mmetsp:Transcript_16959/g.30498  ORF Transcript_16959/g.30498 Transcript_16959/m.30498 type:complete len:713 (+) Transcript_16959:2175-4313(+)